MRPAGSSRAAVGAAGTIYIVSVKVGLVLEAKTEMVVIGKIYLPARQRG